MPNPFHFHFSQKGDKTNATVLLLHGFLGCCSDWDEVITQLSRNYHCLAVDLPGHGKTEVTGGVENYSMERCAEGLEELLDQLAIERCHLIGYSMGGRLALYLTLNNPRRFGKVIIESASPGLKTEEERRLRREQDIEAAKELQSVPIDEFLSQWYSQPLFNSLQQDRERFQKLLKKREQNDPAKLAISLLQMGTGAQPPLWDRLAELENELLLLTGEKDHRFQAIGDEIASQTESAKIQILPGCGHNVHFENPGRFVENVEEFLREQAK